MPKNFTLFFCTIIFCLFVLHSYKDFLYNFNCVGQIDKQNEKRLHRAHSYNKSQNSPFTLDYIEKGSEHIPNLPPSPYILGVNKYGPKFFGNKSCAPFPYVYGIKFSNVIWQLQEQTNWTFHLFGAYWDIRSTNKDAPSVRILSMMNKRDETVGTNYCQIWFENRTEPLITEITSYSYIWNKHWGNYNDASVQPYLMNCPIPKDRINDTAIPMSVSIVPSPCSPATNNLRIHFDKPEKKEKFAVCVKGMDFIVPDWSVRLVEWIELLLLFGVHKIFFYELAVHPNVRKVFQYYEDLNKIQVFPLTNAGTLPNEAYLRHAFLKKKIVQKRQHELIPYNDCLYRNMYKYEYISLLDIDEIIVPHNEASTWPDLVKILEKHNTENYIPYFVFANVHFIANEINSKTEEYIPEHFYMLQHTVRNSKDAGKGSGIKCFHRPENILTLHNHFPTTCISKCPKIFVNHSDGFLHHYSYRSRKPGPEPLLDKYNNTITFVVDETLWKWKNELITRSNKVLLNLELI